MRVAAAIAVAGALLAASASAAAGPLTVSVRARALQPGEPVFLDVASTVTLSGVEAHVFGQTVPGFQADPEDPRHWRVLIGIDLDAALGAHVAVVRARSADGPLETTVSLRVVAKTFRTRRLAVDEAFVNPPAAVQPRIEAESRQLAAIWSAPSAERFWASGFRRPVAEPANSAFGTRSVFNGQPRSAHSGADFLSPAGTPVMAPAAGRVALAGNLYYSGNTVIIDHGLGVFSLIAHLSRIDVAAGDTIAAGRVVGLVGATGRVTGPHLHWTVRVAGARVDPLALLELR